MSFGTDLQTASLLNCGTGFLGDTIILGITNGVVAYVIKMHD
jgi:hypothetical protein